MKLHTKGHEACLLLVCTIILQVYTASLEGSTWPQSEAADSIKPLTVKPLGTSNVPQDQANKPYWETKDSRTKNETVNESDSGQASADRSKRSADDDSCNGDGDTAEDESEDTTPNTNQEQDDASIEDSAEDPSDTRRRRGANDEEREHRRDDDDSKDEEEEEDGGLTKEAAVVSPIRRRQIPEDKDNTDASISESAGYDDTNPDTTEDTENTESSTATMNRRKAETSTLGTLDGSPVIVVAPSGVPVKDIPKQLDHTIKKLEQRIDHFAEIATGDHSTVPTVGVLAGNSTKQDNGTIIHTISSAQYIVH